MSIFTDAQSEFLKLGKSDLVKGAITAGFTAIGAALIGVINSGAFPTTGDIEADLKIGVLAALGYLVKNFLSNSQGTPLSGEPPK